MNRKIISITAIIIILISAGGYFVLNEQKSSSLQMITNFEECVRAGYPIAESYPAQCFTPDGRGFVEEIEPPSGPITISGEMACLPKIGQGAQTKECAMGLKGIGIDRRYYGLKNLFKLDPEYKFSVGGLQVEVSGTFSPEDIKGPDGNTYDVVGVIDVTSIKEADSTSIPAPTTQSTRYKEDGTCPSGYVDYGIPLQCVTPEYMEYCKTHSCPQ